jgi:gamma-glutamylcyclotransferase
MSPSSTPTVYFGYGSNLWLQQMRTRCPSSPYIGIARLDNYRWIINDRGYANVVEISSSTATSPDTNTSTSPPTSDVVYGLVYTLTPTDESRLDVNEGVPIAYTKEILPCSFWSSSSSSRVDVSKPPTDSNKKMLVYIDRKRTAPDEPKEEYVYRMNKGIDDALAMGVPKKYVDEVMRKFIPKDAKSDRDGEVAAKALRQATHFNDESGVF